MIGKLQEPKKKSEILPYSSEVSVPRYFRFMFWKDNFGKFAPDKPALCGHRSVNLFVYVYDICLHKT